VDVFSSPGLATTGEKHTTGSQNMEQHMSSTLPLFFELSSERLQSKTKL
jgi:hypothetical protein